MMTAPIFVAKFAILPLILVNCRIPLYRAEHHPSVEMWLDRFERTKGDLIIMKVDEFRDKTITQIASVGSLSFVQCSFYT